MTAPLFGLLLAGGASSRMQRDKAALQYHGKPQLERAYELLGRVCVATFVSVRPDQRDEKSRARFPQIVDRESGVGPLAGILAALEEHPKAAWLVLACDLPFLAEETLRRLIDERDPERIATAYRSAHDRLPEPLCAVWEPAAREAARAHLASGKKCPRKLLINSDVKLIDLADLRALDNVNTTEEFAAANAALGSGSGSGSGRLALGAGQNESGPASDPQADSRGGEQSSPPGPLTRAQRPAPRALKTVRVQYFAVLREQAGRSEEMLDTRASTPAELYEELRARHSFKLAANQLKVALNADFSDWRAPLRHGDVVVFIPPVAGG